MKIAGHTMGTPEHTLPEAIDLFARLGLEGVEAICHDEYRSAIRTGSSSAALQALRRRAESQGLAFAAIAPYPTDLNSHDPRVATLHRDLLLRAIDIAHALGARCVRTYPGRETGGPGRADRFRRLVEAARGPAKDLSFKDAPPAATSGAVEALPEEAKPTISRVVGEGTMPWRDIIAELRRTGYEGWLSIEYERRWYPDLLPPAEVGMKAGAEAVRRILSGLN